MAKSVINEILVYADWVGIDGPRLMGTLKAEQLRGKQIFSFSYDTEWIKSGRSQLLDPQLGFYSGPQYYQEEKPNFGLFTDSSPDRWGRVLMERREAYNARQEKRKPKTLMESDFLLGVFDLYRMGGLRFKTSFAGPFLDDNSIMAAPPMTSLRTLEEASLHLEEDDASDDPSFATWLNLLFSPGSSLGGARPKASVTDPKGNLWIAKFPSRNDERDIGGWEAVVNKLALNAGVNMAEGQAKKFAQERHTFITKRFDRNKKNRIHFASAMTLSGHTDGAGASTSVSYLDIAEILVRNGANTDNDLEELWRRIVFNICTSNSDDHLRNHGFLLTANGWILSPAFDINPIPNSSGLSLNISTDDNALELDLARDVAEDFRVPQKKREQIIRQVTKSISHWEEIAKTLGMSRNEISRMAGCFITG